MKSENEFFKKKYARDVERMREEEERSPERKTKEEMRRMVENGELPENYEDCKLEKREVVGESERKENCDKKNKATQTANCDKKQVRSSRAVY